MSVAVSCNLSDGVILGVDSAITLSGAGGVAKVYENAEKLFQLGNKSIGIAGYGMAGFEARTLGSYLREFENLDPNQLMSNPAKMIDIVEELRKFFLTIYQRTIIPYYEKAAGKKFDEIPESERPALGIVVGGFSDGEYLSEVWNILVPAHSAAHSAQRKREQGVFGTNWFALFEPIRRYIKGYDRDLLNDLLNYFAGRRKQPISDEEKEEIKSILSKYEYQIPFPAMPIQEGIEHVRFLVELVIKHHRYAIGAPVVGGKAQVGLVTYKGGRFVIT